MIFLLVLLILKEIERSIAQYIYINFYNYFMWINEFYYVTYTIIFYAKFILNISRFRSIVENLNYHIKDKFKKKNFL